MENKQILQEFECCIDSIDLDKKTFWATLYDVTNPRYDIEEMAEFDFLCFQLLIINIFKKVCYLIGLSVKLLMRITLC